eukprot:4557419-Amphidinium_carterae.1
MVHGVFCNAILRVGKGGMAKMIKLSCADGLLALSKYAEGWRNPLRTHGARKAWSSNQSGDA